MMNLLAGVVVLLAQTNDKTQANAHDDAWEMGWYTHCRAIYTGGTGKTSGFVLQIGDSITHANPYRQWPRSGAGNMSGEDDTIVQWCMANATLPSTQNDTTSKDGFYLATADTVVTGAYRGMTSASGLDTTEFTTGAGNGTTAMPADPVQASAALKVADGATYDGDLHMTTVAAAFGDAQFAVLMLGTNDVPQNDLAGFTTRLTSIVNALEGKNIVVVLSTIPPRTVGNVVPFNDAIRTLAQGRGLPLIDYYAEILARQPGTAWQGTLISGDGVHPTGAAAGANPYVSGGSSATHTTGTNAATDGYLLRSWLTIQKLKEVRDYIVLNNPPAPPPPPPPPPPPAPKTSTSGSSDNLAHRCGCDSIADASPFALGLAALLGLGLATFRRR
ncbi:MAG TPA: SGNH/GDSL hydrolase family protein [Planctomycetota bacterium]|nr:SGNH/GDSL hydrolase family protein [Planctomycetota bacterium]